MRFFVFFIVFGLLISSATHALGKECVVDFKEVAPKRLDPQFRIWALQEASKTKGSVRLREKVTQQLREGKVLTTEAVGKEVGARNKVKFVELEGGIRGVWKPLNRRTKKEVTAYQFDQTLGSDLVPVTVERELNGQKGVIQLFVRKTDGAALRYTPRELMLFDYLTGHFDRHPGNYLTAQGRTIAIDNENTFLAKIPSYELPDFEKFIGDQLAKVQSAGNSPQSRAKAVSEIAPSLINREAIEKLKTLSNEDWARQLPDLNPLEMKAFLKRKEKAVDAILLAEKELGTSIYPSGRFSSLNRNRWPGAVDRFELVLSKEIPSAARYRFTRAQQLVEKELFHGGTITELEIIRIEDALKELEEFQ